MGLKAVRATYLLGAVIDALAGIQLLLPRSVTLVAFRGLRLPGADGYPAAIAAVLMFGFTGILLWGSRNPVGRRGVLLVTLLAILGLAAVNIVWGALGLIAWSDLAGALVIQAFLTACFAASYRFAGRAAGDIGVME